MSRITDTFKNSKPFIPFITCGDPDLETTEKLIYALADEGAGIIELGIPFSDPTAEGPVIQAANIRSLSGGITTDKIFDFVKKVRANTDIPLVFMTYANVIFSYGTERFAGKCRDVGIDGLILPDMSYEEKEEFAPVFKKYGVDYISLIAPTSEQRIRTIAEDADGFLYCVSSLGVTGVRSEITTDIGAMVRIAKQARPDLPVAVGFGISTPESAKKMAGVSDGVIVGSAIVKLIAEHGRDCEPYVREITKNMVEAVKDA